MTKGVPGLSVTSRGVLQRSHVQVESRTSQSWHGHRGLTLVEMLVGIAIFSVLVGAIIIGARAMYGSQRADAARQQLALLSSAIDRYASFWPQWKVGSTVAAERGWPDYIPGRLFVAGADSYESQPFNGDFNYIISGAGSGVLEDPTGETEDKVQAGGDVLGGNICLAYSLLSATGKGPYLQVDDDQALLKDISAVDGSAAFPLLPARTAAGMARRKLALVDPWGTPYRYFWVYRDQSAYQGFMPITTADTGDSEFHLAEGFVLESAGPDRKFGNIWKYNPTLEEVVRAKDNILRQE